jgi:hypothetical protein
MPIVFVEDKTNPLTGRMWSTFTKVSTSLNGDLLTDNVVRRWSFIMEVIQKIDETKWELADLKQGGTLDTLVIYQKSFDDFETKPDWNIPNIESMYALAKCIKFLGHLWFQSTDIDEGTNKFYQGCIRVLNQINASNHMLTTVQYLSLVIQCRS